MQNYEKVKVERDQVTIICDGCGKELDKIITLDDGWFKNNFEFIVPRRLSIENLGFGNSGTLIDYAEIDICKDCEEKVQKIYQKHADEIMKELHELLPEAYKRID